jgi:hypothetical protein
MGHGLNFASGQADPGENVTLEKRQEVTFGEIRLSARRRRV